MMFTATESGANFSFEADMGRKQQNKRARAALTAVLGGVLAVALLVAVNASFQPVEANLHHKSGSAICNRSAMQSAQYASASSCL